MSPFPSRHCGESDFGVRPALLCRVSRDESARRAVDAAPVAQRQVHGSHCFPQRGFSCPPVNKAALTPWAWAPSL